MDKLLDQLGADFKAAWNAAEDIDDNSPDGKVLNAGRWASLRTSARD